MFLTPKTKAERDRCSFSFLRSLLRYSWILTSKSLSFRYSPATAGQMSFIPSSCFSLNRMICNRHLLARSSDSCAYLWSGMLILSVRKISTPLRIISWTLLVSNFISYTYYLTKGSYCCSICLSNSIDALDLSYCFSCWNYSSILRCLSLPSREL